MATTSCTETMRCGSPTLMRSGSPTLNKYLQTINKLKENLNPTQLIQYTRYIEQEIPTLNIQLTTLTHKLYIRYPVWNSVVHEDKKALAACFYESLIPQLLNYFDASEIVDVINEIEDVTIPNVIYRSTMVDADDLEFLSGILESQTPSPSVEGAECLPINAKNKKKRSKRPWHVRTKQVGYMSGDVDALHLHPKDIERLTKKFNKHVDELTFTPFHGKKGTLHYSLMADRSYSFSHVNLKPNLRNKFRNLIYSITGRLYNSCLVIKYNDKTGLNMHKDDEEIHSSDEVLTITLSGNARVVVQSSDDEIELEASPGLAYRLNNQERIKHGVKNSTERIALSFRNFKPIAQEQSLQLAHSMQNLTNETRLNYLKNFNEQKLLNQRQRILSSQSFYINGHSNYPHSQNTAPLKGMETNTRFEEEKFNKLLEFDKQHLHKIIHRLDKNQVNQHYQLHGYRVQTTTSEAPSSAPVAGAHDVRAPVNDDLPEG